MPPRAALVIAGLSLSVLACGSKVEVESGGAGGGGDGGEGGAGGTPTTGPDTTGSTSSTTSGITSTTTMSVTTTSSTGSGPLVLGLPCVSDAECGQGGKCLSVQGNSAVLGGGPPGGYCSKDCLTDSDCPGFDSWCLTSMIGPGECFLGCEHGAPALQSVTDPLDPEKCHGREDLRCQPVDAGPGVCLPTCGSDAQCAGRFCDAKLAVCVDVPSEGKPVGDECDPNGVGMGECAGLCIPIVSDGGEPVGMCSTSCALGGDVYDPFECGGPGYSICLYSPAGSGAGDNGFCGEVCGAQDHCATPNFWCFNIGLSEYGVCIISHPCSSDAECDFPGSTCVDTPLGQHCMSPEYPLGNL